MVGRKVLAIVGMPGSGKTEVANIFYRLGYPIIHFGDMTQRELLKRGLEVNEKNEKFIRELLRKKLGMAAYAILNLPRIKRALKRSPLVIIDGLYSWSEYKHLRDKFGENFKVLAVIAPRNLRHKRLMKRKVRPLTKEECISRDEAEIENLEKGGPISAADFYVLNDGTLKQLRDEVLKIVKKI